LIFILVFLLGGSCLTGKPSAFSRSATGLNGSFSGVSFFDSLVILVANLFPSNTFGSLKFQSMVESASLEWL
jgi:hypothetical protein